jgi:hypothetical protein
MAVVNVSVPSRARMAHGIGKAILYGIEYDVVNDNEVELTCSDQIKLAKMIVAFGGEILSASITKPVIVEMPRHEA